MTDSLKEDSRGLTLKQQMLILKTYLNGVLILCIIMHYVLKLGRKLKGCIILVNLEALLVLHFHII